MLDVQCNDKRKNKDPQADDILMIRAITRVPDTNVTFGCFVLSSYICTEIGSVRKIVSTSTIIDFCTIRIFG